MKITFTIDSILSNKLDGSDSAEHWDTYHLIKEAENRGHDVRMVQSEDAIIGKGFSKELYLNNNKIIYRDFTLPDALMIRGYGMRVGKECFDNLVDTVKSIEENISLVVNSSSATAYSRKDNQKKLPLPFIPTNNIMNGSLILLFFANSIISVPFSICMRSTSISLRLFLTILLRSSNLLICIPSNLFSSSVHSPI